MSSIVTNKDRVGSFTSSEVHCLIPLGSRPMNSNELAKYKKENPSGKKKNIDAGFQRGGLTYIRKKYYERKLKRSLDMGAYGKSMSWGLFLEQFVYNNFADWGYEITANTTHVNPKLRFHAGSTDLIKKAVKVGDIKCYEPLMFCQMGECLLQEDIELFKKDFPQQYWQLVSNSVIHNTPKAESIIYMPTLIELAEIKDLAMDYDGSDQWKYRFIYENEDWELAYVPDDSEYESIISFEFTVPQEDKDFLEGRLALAELELQKLYKKK